MTESMRSKGMRDMLPNDMARFRRIELTFRDVALGWGYEEVRTPTIEHLYLFTSAGTLSPQMLDRVYSFLDWDGWSGERVVLRPDSTIPTVRLFSEQMSDADSARLFYVQNVLRFEQGDAEREGWQCGVELLGDTYPRGDVELILLARETLQRLGLGPRLKLSHPGIVRALLDKAGLSLEDQLALYDRVLAGDLAPLDEVEAKLPGSASVRSLLSMEGQGLAYIQNLTTVLEPIVPEIAAPLGELAAVSAMLDGMGVAHEISPLLVRSFEYYTGPVFHAFVGDIKVGGGGRYDGLVSLVGSRDLPASGFALDIDAIAPLLDAAAEDARVITIHCESPAGDDLAQAFALAIALRQVQTLVRVTAGAGRGEVVVIEGAFHVALNGGKPERHTDIDAVVRAVSRS
ncbi:MAG: HisS family protein [Chloroflexota bacterium]